MAQKKDYPQADGLLVLHKPSGPTSTDCLNRIKARFRQKKVGHGGTLDPLASGVLLVLFGQGTKLVPYLSEESKTYTGTLVLGMETDSYDIQGRTVAEKSWSHVSEDQVRQMVRDWEKLENQEVPPVSAAKHKGKPLYALQRAGKEIPVKIKRIRITHAEVTGVDLPHVRFRVTCSPGTYVRSLVHSLGKRLGTGAVLTELVREACHPFTLAQAVTLDTLLELEPESLGDHIIPLSDVLPHWPGIRLDREQTQAVMQGMRLPVDSRTPGEAGDRVMVFDPHGAPLALVQAQALDSSLHWVILRGLWKTPAPNTSRGNDDPLNSTK
jgi:tRNA pseudouridine55 synthase